MKCCDQRWLKAIAAISAGYRDHIDELDRLLSELSEESTQAQDAIRAAKSLRRPMLCVPFYAPNTRSLCFANTTMVVGASVLASSPAQTNPIST